MERLRTLFALLACLFVATALAACGDSEEGGDTLDENTPAETVLDRTFAADQTIESGVIDLRFAFDVSRGETSSTFRAGITGPVDSSGDGLPTFDFNGHVKADSPQRKLDVIAGATSTGDAAYVSYDGTFYEVDPQTFDFLNRAFEQSEEAAGDEGSDSPVGLPAIRDFLKNVKNEGTEEVEGVEAVHVSGTVDVDGLIERIRPLAAGAAALGVGPANIPTPQELDGLAQLVRSASFDVWSGAEDNLLRRFSAVIDLEQPGGTGTAQMKIGLLLGDVNEPQEIEAPENTRPLSELLDEVGLDGLNFGSLGGLGTDDSAGSDPGGMPPVPGGGSSGGGQAPEGVIPTLPPTLPSVPTPEQREEYIQCVTEVVTAEDLQRCQEILR